MPPKKILTVVENEDDYEFKAAKVDDVEKFNALPEPSDKVSDSWAHDTKIKYKGLYNVFVKKYPTIARDDVSWVGERWKEIRDYITTSYSISSQKSFFNQLGNILLSLDKHKYKVAYRELINSSKLAGKVAQKENESSKLSEKDRTAWLHLPELESVRDSLERKREADPQDKHVNIAHLILCLNTYLPPVRLDYLTAEFYPVIIDSKKKGKKPVKGFTSKIKVPPANWKTTAKLNDIYYLYMHKPGEWAIYMHGENKVGHLREGVVGHTIFLDEEIQYDRLNNTGLPTGEKGNVTNARKLNSVITKSLEDYPRDFLLVNKSGGVMDQPTYNGILKKETGANLHQNLLRKIFIHWWHKSRDQSRQISYSVMKQIAEYMRHDVKTAISDYMKVTVPEYTGAQVKIYIPPAPIKVDYVEEKKKEYYDPKVQGKIYREKNKEILKAKRVAKYTSAKGYDTEAGKKVLARKMLWYLNTGGTKQPKAISKDKYQLRYDESIKQWVSGLL